MSEVQRVRKRVSTSSGKPTTVLVANLHTAGIALQRTDSEGNRIDAIEIAPGETKPVDAKDWEKIKKSPAIQVYLDHAILAVVQKANPRPYLEALTSDPPIPDHLQAVEHKKGKLVDDLEAPKASVRRASVSEMTF